MAKENRPAWFKMFRNQKALIDSVPDDTVGKALKAIFQYFENGEVVDMNPLEFAVFSSVKPYVDESVEDYEKSVEAGKVGANKRWGNNGR